MILLVDFLGSVSANAHRNVASSNSAASGVQSSSRTMKASTSQSSRQSKTMSLINGMYYMEVDVQVSVIKTDGQNYHTDNKIFFKYLVWLRNKLNISQIIF